MKLTKYLKLAILFLTISLLYNACEKEETFVEEEQTVETQELKTTPNVKTVSYENAGATFNNLKNQFHLDAHIQLEHAGNELARTTQDTLGITIYTDDIKEVTLGNYTSYTMGIATPNTSDSKFYNLTIEDKNGTPDMFVTKYTPTEYWSNNKNEAYQGGITTMRTNDFTDVFDETEGESNDSNGDGSNDGQTSYPTNCNGMVISTTTLTGYQCGCGHWPWQTCNGSTCGAPTYPGYEYITTYECIGQSDVPNGGNTSDSDNNTNQGGGASGNGNPVDPDDSSITVVIDTGGEECDLPPEAQPYDTDGICGLSAYEACLMNYDNIDALNNYYSSLSPFNVDLSSVRVPCDNIDTSQAQANAKFMCIYNRLSQTSGFKNLFINTFGESSEANIKFELVDLPDNIGGKNIADVGNINNQTIQINKNHLTTKHPLTIAQTIIHEAVHAYLKVKAYECSNGNTIDSLNNLELDQLLSNPNFDYSCLSTAVNEHDLMFNILVPYMQVLLNNVFNNLVATEDLNPIFNFYPPPNGDLHVFSWENALYYMSLAGLDDTENNNDAFSNALPSGGAEFFLYENYNLLINEYDTDVTPPFTNFNFSTCNN